MEASELVAKVIVNEGVRSVFALPSGEILPLCEHLRDEGVNVIFARHEQAVGNMAEGYARVTRNAGVAIVPTGPGLASLMPALAQAYYSGSPIVAISGHSKFENLDRNAFEEIEGARWVERYVKWSKMPIFPERLHEYVQEAFRHALSGKFGPALLEIPKDVLNAEVENDVELAPPERYRYTGRIVCESRFFDRAIEMLNSAEKPVIVAGSGVYWSGAEEELRMLAERLSIPVAVNGMAFGTIPTTHPLYAGPAPGNVLLKEADLVMVIGTRLDDFLGFGVGLFSDEARIIQVDIDWSQIGKNRYVDLGVVSDAKAFLSGLLERANGIKRFDYWAKEFGEMAKGMMEMLVRPASENGMLKPQEMMLELSSLITRDDIVVLDGGETTAWGLLLLKAERAGNVFNSQGELGHLGAGVPMGIAAKSAFPEKRVFVVTGDGSFLFNGVEIETAVRHELPIIVIVANDSAWGMVCHTRYLSTGSKERACFGTLLNENARYDKFAESLGAYGELVEKKGELTEAIRRAVESGMPAVIDVRISREEMSPLAYMLSGVEG
ncbi:Thiamine pyrophosphate-requiring protein [Geoglobus ahangari]|uniref:Thiamine pyrophosphate-requiring protein n=1 Tax=Geoglobus ahangari TaxID=113653 RepID=A0A0F7IHA5_9EURY|nr:thiamine pyrophosphate-binding protein [Geoglobus ahangari]AKG92317.1 Thiamine pyrophosphate-requiring protein [Geoglobus ahangari]